MLDKNMICQTCENEYEPKIKCKRSKFCSKRCKMRSHFAYIDAWARKKRGRYVKGKKECKLCGLYFHRPCSHAVQVHGITAREYKESQGYDVSKGILSNRSKEIATVQAQNNLPIAIECLKKGAKYRFVKGDKRAGNYKRSQETINRLKKIKNG